MLPVFPAVNGPKGHSEFVCELLLSKPPHLPKFLHEIRKVDVGIHAGGTAPFPLTTSKVIYDIL